MLTRRAFLQTSAVAAAAPQPAPPKRLAIVTTIYRYLSHGQHMGDRFLVGYPYAGAWQRPNIKVVSLYVDQKPEAIEVMMAHIAHTGSLARRRLFRLQIARLHFRRHNPQL